MNLNPQKHRSPEALALDPARLDKARAFMPLAKRLLLTILLAWLM